MISELPSENIDDLQRKADNEYDALQKSSETPELSFLSRGFGKMSARPTTTIPTVVIKTAAHLYNGNFLRMNTRASTLVNMMIAPEMASILLENLI